MAGPDEFSPTIQRLRELLAQCEELRKKSRMMTDDTKRMLEDTEKRIAECVARIEKDRVRK